MVCESKACATPTAEVPPEYIRPAARRAMETGLSLRCEACAEREDAEVLVTLGSDYEVTFGKVLRWRRIAEYALRELGVTAIAEAIADLDADR